MGLDFRAEGVPDSVFDAQFQPSWSYSGFNRFRERLAQSAGVELERLWSEDSYRQAQVGAPLYDLLMHSDCDGFLSSLQCARMQMPLALVVWDWQPRTDYDRLNALKLAWLMNYCALTQTRLIFC